MLKRILMAVGLFAALQCTAHAGAFFFDLPIHVRWNGGAYAVAVADFNGDGRDDLAALVEGHLEVLLQDGTGALATPLQLEIPSVVFYAIHAADLGANGSSEILVGHDGGLAVFAWNGAGGFALKNHAAQSRCGYMATADLDFDGAPDVFCHGQLGDAALYYSSQGNDLKAPVYMVTPAYDLYATTQVQLRDVTGDGKPDLLLASSGSNSFFVYPHDGSRGFLPAVAYPYPEEDDLWSSAIEVMDVDGDGSNEVIVAKPCNRPCSGILVYRRSNQGYLTLSKRLASYDNPSALLAADIDRDGHQDLLVGHAGWFAVGRYMGLGQDLSSVETLAENVQTFFGSNRYAVGDLDHDGFTDLAVANFFGVSLLYGRRRVASDFDGDGVSDLLWRHSAGRNVVWRSAQIATPTSIDDIDPAWSVQATSDFDNDGKSDVFWRNRESGANEIRLSATLHQDVTAVTNQDWQVVGAGDFDGGGHSDLLWRNMRTGANTIWKSGYSSTPQATNGMTDLRWAVVGVGDFNRDGRSDILWRHSTTGANVIWHSGQRAEQRALTGVTNLAWQIAGVGDFDGDGADDLLWRNRSTGANTIWLSGNSSANQTVTGVTNLVWTIAAVADYDGDGRSDLLWRKATTGDNVIWRSADARQQQAVAPVRDLRWKPVP
jgi:hypothetical protein